MALIILLLASRQTNAAELTPEQRAANAEALKRYLTIFAAIGALAAAVPLALWAGRAWLGFPSWTAAAGTLLGLSLAITAFLAPVRDGLNRVR